MPATAFEIRPDDLTGEATVALLRLHLSGMQAHSPPGHVHALDIAGLTAPGVSFWSVWHGTRIAGIGALRVIDPHRGEIKSMRTHPDFLRQGVGDLLVRHMIAVARAKGLTILSLETGSGPAFEPALALYRRHGFVNGEAFGNYQASAFNQFLHLALDQTLSE
jgi:putative acetyltransferase